MANRQCKEPESSRQESKRRRATDRPAVDIEGRIIIGIGILVVLAATVALFLSL